MFLVKKFHNIFVREGIVNRDFYTYEDIDNGQKEVILRLWENQSPIIKLWFALSGLSIMAVYFVLMAKF